ncbi:hypothetical protein NDA17_006629 [Ustilago hordei]|nr:hypothetical protein NDA17_006629 [Ustilago hordei]
MDQQDNSNSASYPIPSLPCNLSNVDCFNVMNCSTYKMLIGHLLDNIETAIMHSLMVESKMQLDLMDVDATWHPNDDLEDSDDDMFDHAVSFALIRTYDIISQLSREPVSRNGVCAICADREVKSAEGQWNNHSGSVVGLAAQEGAEVSITKQGLSSVTCRYHNHTLYYTNSNIPYTSHIAIPSIAIITSLSLRRPMKSIVSGVSRLKPRSVMMTPRSGVSVDDDEVDGVGDKWTTAFSSIYIQTADLLWATFGHQVVCRHCVNSFDTAPPPCYPACLAPLCLLSGVDSFDTAPPPQDLVSTPLTLVSRAPECIQAHDSNLYREEDHEKAAHMVQACIIVHMFASHYDQPDEVAEYLKASENLSEAEVLETTSGMEAYQQAIKDARIQ